nr:unnamed protein product [Digitaria exilis]
MALDLVASDSEDGVNEVAGDGGGAGRVRHHRERQRAPSPEALSFAEVAATSSTMEGALGTAVLPPPAKVPFDFAILPLSKAQVDALI